MSTGWALRKGLKDQRSYDMGLACTAGGIGNYSVDNCLCSNDQVQVVVGSAKAMTRNEVKEGIYEQ